MFDDARGWTSNLSLAARRTVLARKWMILDIVRPGIILTFGNSEVSPFQYLLEKARGENSMRRIEIDTLPSGHGHWKCKAFTAFLEGGKRTVIGLPHLSRYEIEGKPAVIEWIGRQAAQQSTS